MKKRSLTGQSMTEYAFAGALIFAVCIGVLILTGGNLLVFGKKYSTELYKATGDDVKILGQSAGFGMGGVIPPPKPGEQQICMNSGYCLNLPSSVTSGLTAETIAGNGGDITLAMAAVLSQIAAQMANDPNADPYLKDLITKLANKGHDLGHAENLVESHPWVAEQLAKGWDINITSDKDDYMNIDGRADVMDYQVSGINEQMNNINLNRTQFLQLYGQYLNYVSANPNAMPPGLDGIVKMEANEIDVIAGTAFGSGWAGNGITETLASTYAQQGAAASGDMGYNMIGAADASQITHQDSNTICTTKGAGCIQNPG